MNKRAFRKAITRMRAKVMMTLRSRRDSAAIFSNIYRKKSWARGASKSADFWSGDGSAEQYTLEYARVIGDFVNEHKIGTIVDLGCGDFQVGQRIIEVADCRYIGVDVVPDLVERNSRLFATDQVSFVCKDIAKDELPAGDLCLIRQVLQHLDNETIQRVFKHVSKYPFCIVTESQLNHPEIANVDIKSGAWTRTLFGSGLYFDQPPFSKKIKTLLNVQRNASTVIHTCLIVLSAQESTLMNDG